MDKSLILKRIKNEKKFKTDTELANFLGISKAVLSNWYKRNTIDYDLILSKCEQMDLNFILRGDNNTIIDKSESNSTIYTIDNASMGFILDRYEALVADNALLKKENEDLKNKKGKPDHIVDYAPLSGELTRSVAAEPGTDK